MNVTPAVERRMAARVVAMFGSGIAHRFLIG